MRRTIAAAQAAATGCSGRLRGRTETFSSLIPPAEPGAALFGAPSRATAADDVRPSEGLYANSGGPMSRTRTERVVSSLLGTHTGEIHCPRVIHLALDFGSADPWEALTAILHARGFDTVESYRATIALPAPMLCRTNLALAPRRVSESDPDDVLHDAILLGLCTAVFFDPARPVIWTRSSLTRRLELYEMEGFYA